MYLPKNEGSNFELTPDGTFVARCYRFIDMGSHDQSFNGESKGLKRLIMIGFELPTELMSDGRPFSIHKRYTWSMHEKATLRKDLEAWRGAKFTDADFGPGGFDVRNLLGKASTLGIVHSQTGENTYANISSISKAMKGVEIPDAINPPVYFSLEPQLFDAEVFDGLSEKLKEFIRPTPEYISATRPRTNSYAKQHEKEQEADPARDPRYESETSFDERNPPPVDDSDFPGDYPIDQGGNRTHPHMAG